MAKKVLITGASGLLGSFIARRLLQQDFQLLALKRTDSDLSLLHDIEDQIEWFECDLLDLLTVEKVVAEQKPNFVVHSAAMVSYLAKERTTMQQINVEGTATITNVCLKHKIEKLIHISSISAIGKETGKSELHEKSKWENEELQSAYGLSKYQSELEVWRAHAEGLDVAVFCPSVILGPGVWHKSSTQIFDYVRKGKKFYTYGQLNYVDVRDVAEAVLQAIAQPISGKYILNGGVITYKEAFADIAKHFGLKAPSIAVRQSWVVIAAYFDWLLSKLTAKKPMLSIETARLGKNNYTYSSNKIIGELDFKFTPWNESISWCCEQLLKKTEKK